MDQGLTVKPTPISKTNHAKLQIDFDGETVQITGNVTHDKNLMLNIINMAMGAALNSKPLILPMAPNPLVKPKPEFKAV